MRLFRHRGDIYIPSTKFKSDLEQKILFIAISCILVFTIVFVAIFGFKYDFSVKKFFKPENLEIVEEEDIKSLPNVSGKNNFLFLLKNKDTDEIYVCSLIQVNLDDLAYTVCSIDPKTTVEGKKITDIYKKGNAGNVLNAVNSLFGINIDYFIDQNLKQYKSLFDYIGEINYTVAEDIRYKDNSYYGFNIKVASGNQKVDGDLSSKLMRYYLTQKRYDLVDELILTALSQQINMESYEKKEKIFSRLIDNSITNITIKDYNEADDQIRVLSDETTGAAVYSVSPKYDGNKIVSKSIQEIKGYFDK
ncbi:MAG: LCP family protein [Eubacterium sp.]|nr:LCP family protein [Eubacterium sp.]